MQSGSSGCSFKLKHASRVDALPPQKVGVAVRLIDLETQLHKPITFHKYSIPSYIMALNPKFAGQKLAAHASPYALHTLELYLDYVCE